MGADSHEIHIPNFDINCTNACKGVGLILLLWHHLFYQHPEFGLIVYSTAQLAKVCVAMFVILSGYGFTESVKCKKTGLFQFYKNRLTPIYINYWFIALIFVTIGSIFAGRFITSAYTSHAYIKFIIQMTGLHRYFYEEYGYNATWWYLSVIIPLIVLFPFIHDTVRKYGYFPLLFLLSLLLPRQPVVIVINDYILPFALGIYMSQRSHFATISTWLNKFGWLRYIIMFIAIIAVATFRTYSPLLNGTKTDWLFGLLMIVLIFEMTMTAKILNKPLELLGKNLFNVFLFHSFIYYYFWKEFIYSFSNPIPIFIVLLSLSIFISESLEYAKKFILLYSIYEKSQKYEVPLSIEIPFQEGAVNPD